MGKAKDQSKALDVIGHKLRIKDEIDRDFDEKELLNSEVEISIPENKEKKLETLHYSLNYKDFGLNVFANLNLGKAYKLTGEYADGVEYNIPQDAKREKYTISDKDAMDEEWLDYLISKVSGADNALIILENIFTRVTTGNYQSVLPYKEQLLFAYKKFSNPNLKGKILGLVRGVNEEEIIKYGGPDLMLKLGKMLGIKNRVISNPVLKIDVKDSYLKNKGKTISIIGVNQKTTATKGVFRIMQDFEKTHPGFDIYYNTTAKQNGLSTGLTTYIDEKGQAVKKPCWFICYGPMFEYDKANLNRPSIEPYVLNKAWYKIGHTYRIKDGEVVPNVRVDYEDYIYPNKIKEDFSNFSSAVIVDEIKALLDDYKNKTNFALNQAIDNSIIKTRKELGGFIKYGEGEEK